MSEQKEREINERVREEDSWGTFKLLCIQLLFMDKILLILIYTRNDEIQRVR